MKFKKKAGMTLNLALALALFVFCQFLLLVNGAAYLDPSTMTYVIQIVAGAVIASGTAVAVFWHKIKRFFKRVFKAEERRSAPDAAKNKPAEPSAATPVLATGGQDAPAAAEKKKCPFCGAELAGSAAKFCSECGAALQKKCPSCGVEITALRAKFCSECGTALNG
ncbi:MAG: zinc ribbon domain-containing protein [Treponema sp.]|jgi:hypothetical protein|nr:zinc ribbon domain-containing protein [Treponema sp.]